MKKSLKKILINRYLIPHCENSVFSTWSTFGSNYSLESSWVWWNKLCTHGFFLSFYHFQVSPQIFNCSNQGSDCATQEHPERKREREREKTIKNMDNQTKIYFLSQSNCTTEQRSGQKPYFYFYIFLFAHLLFIHFLTTICMLARFHTDHSFILLCAS